MAKYILQDQNDLEDFVQGCLLYGVGGGGNPVEGLKALEEQMALGNTLGWVDPDQLPLGTWVACTFLMGSTAPLTDEKKAQMKELGLNEWKYPRNLVLTTKFLEEYSGKKISALVPLEMGGSNTPVPMAAAAALGKTILDGDYAGRAVPEITQITPVARGVSFVPATSVDKWGNKCIIVDTNNTEMAERIGKMISDASFGSTGLAGFLIPVEEIQDIIIPGTMTEALKAGRIIRTAKEEGKDPAQELCNKLEMYELFRGKVVEKPWEDKEGYYWGTHVLEGEGQFRGKEAKVVFKNENHLFYINDQLLVTSPDLIMNMDIKLGEGRRNEDIAVGDRLAILGCRCKEQLRTPEILKFLGPRHFGANMEYMPIEKVMTSI